MRDSQPGMILSFKVSEIQNGEDTTEPLHLGKFGFAFVLVLVVCSLVFRLLWLGRVPGINGDEGWYGTQVTRMLSGKPWSPLTPSNLPINPQLFYTEALLLLVLEPSGFALRLPIAIWAMIGVVLTFFLHRWVFGDKTESLLTAIFTACLPAHLAYSRFCWDACFSFVSVPLVLYSVLRIVEGRATIWAWTCFVLASILTVWTHATHALFVQACVFAIGWTWLKPWWQWAMASKVRRQRTAILFVLFLLGCLVWQWHAFIWYFAWGDRWLVERFTAGWGAINTVIDLTTGLRVYEYIAGMPRPTWVAGLYALAIPAAVAALIALFRCGRKPDRTLVLLTIFLVLMLLAPAVSIRLRYGSLSYERYLFYFLPLTAASFIRASRVLAMRMGPQGRAVPVVLSLAFSLGFLVQFWHYYLHPLSHHTYWKEMSETPQQTFGTGPIEPKTAAAEAILQTRPPMNSRIYAVDWSIQGPIEYLMNSRFEVNLGPIQFDTDVPIFIVGYSHDSFIATARVEIQRRGWSVVERDFCASTGGPIITLLMPFAP